MDIELDRLDELVEFEEGRLARRQKIRLQRKALLARQSLSVGGRSTKSTQG